MKARLHHLALRLFARLPLRMRRRVVRTLAPQYTVGSMVLVEREDGRVLLIRQSYRKRWGIPGGLLNRGEGPADAARREVLEETGLAIDLVGEPAVVVSPEPRRVDVVFRARPRSGVDSDAATPSSAEIVAAEWFWPTELPELQEETADAVQALARASVVSPGVARYTSGARRSTERPEAGWASRGGAAS